MTAEFREAVHRDFSGYGCPFKTEERWDQSALALK
jgi:hypothetical protein